jgi:hypothetical protein
MVIVLSRGRVKSNTIKLVFAVAMLSIKETEHIQSYSSQNNVSEWRNMSTCGMLFL